MTKSELHGIVERHGDEEGSRGHGASPSPEQLDGLLQAHYDRGALLGLLRRVAESEMTVEGYCVFCSRGSYMGRCDHTDDCPAPLLESLQP